MTPFRYTARAESDARAIWEYIADRSGEGMADRILARIEAECSFLGRSPLAGHERSDLTSRQLRFWSVYAYLIVYRPDTRPIEVVGIIHGARNVKGVLDEEVDEA